MENNAKLTTEEREFAQREMLAIERRKLHNAKVNKKPTKVDFKTIVNTVRHRVIQKNVAEAPQYTYKEAKRIVFYIIEMMTFEKGIDFQFTEENKDVIRRLTAYFFGLPGYDLYVDDRWVSITNNLDLSKGIFLFGPIGCGKTFLMKVFQTAIYAAGLFDRTFKMKFLPELISEVKAGQNLKLIDRYYKEVRCFDDVGYGDANPKVFGNSVNILQEIINHRYQQYESKKLITHFTSNLPVQSAQDGDRLLEGLDKRIDERCISRISKMFNLVLLNGPDYRKQIISNEKEEKDSQAISTPGDDEAKS